jgi:hypothetical protein
MTKVANHVMDLVGLPKIEQKQLEKTFTAAKPVGGVNQPQTESRLPEVQ